MLGTHCWAHQCAPMVMTTFQGSIMSLGGWWFVPIEGCSKSRLVTRVHYTFVSLQCTPRTFTVAQPLLLRDMSRSVARSVRVGVSHVDCVMLRYAAFDCGTTFDCGTPSFNALMFTSTAVGTNVTKSPIVACGTKSIIVFFGWGNRWGNIRKKNRLATACHAAAVLGFLNCVGRRH